MQQPDHLGTITGHLACIAMLETSTCGQLSRCLRNGLSLDESCWFSSAILREHAPVTALISYRVELVFSSSPSL
jgi:hypothetical protein